MIIDPNDENFEPSKRYLIVIPGTGYFHVDTFDELTIDLRPEYARLLATAPASSPSSNEDEDEDEASPFQNDEAEGEENNNEVERQAIIGTLAVLFVQIAQMQAVGQSAPGPITVVSGADYAPYTELELPLPGSGSGPAGTGATQQVVTYHNLTKIEGQIKTGQPDPNIRKYLLVLPLHRSDLFFRMLGLAGLIQINDLNKPGPARPDPNEVN